MSDVQVAIEGILHDGEIWVSTNSLLDCAWKLAMDAGAFDAVEVLSEIIKQSTLAVLEGQND